MIFCFVHNFFFSDNTKVRIFIFFVSFIIFFFGQHQSQNIYFFCSAKREFFFQNLTLGYMTKTLNQIIFFPPPKSEFFFSNIGENGRSLRRRLISVFVVLSMFTMILIDSYHVGFLERYNSLVSLYASFNSGNSFPRFSKRYQYNNMPLIMLKYNGIIYRNIRNMYIFQN